MKIFVTKIESYDGDIEKLIPLLDKKRQQRMQKITGKKARLESLYAGLLLRYAYLEKEREVLWEELICETGENGKPYFANIKDFHFSISHSGEYVAAAVGTEKLGVDIQQKKEPKINVAERFFAKDELTLYENEEDKIEWFYNHWCMKEAASKIDGEGLPEGLKRYCYIDENQANDTKQNENVYIKIFNDLPEYKCVCASRKNIFEDICRVEFIDSKIFFEGI